MTTPSDSSSDRPGCLIFITAILGVYQIIFAFRVLQQADILSESSLPVAMQVTVATVWAVGFLLATVGLVRHNRLALRYSGWLIVTFILYNLLRVVAFAQADYDRQRLPFLMILTLIILIVPLVILLQRGSDDIQK